MKSGTWTIILESDEIAVQRTITLNVGSPQTVVVTVSQPHSYLLVYRAGVSATNHT